MYNSFDAEIHVEESGNFAAYNDQRELENELGFYGVPYTNPQNRPANNRNSGNFLKIKKFFAS